MVSMSREQYQNEATAGRSRYKGISPNSEDAIQAFFFEWVTLNESKHPELSLMFSIPNGSNKSKTQRWVMKLTGLKSGVPDTCLPLQSRMKDIDHQYLSLWIEFKSAKGVLSPNQKTWIAALRSQNHRVEICRDWITAARIVSEYLDLGIKI